MVRGSTMLAATIAFALLLLAAMWVFDHEERLSDLESELAILRVEHDSHAELVKRLHKIGVTVPGERRKGHAPKGQSRPTEGHRGK